MKYLLDLTIDGSDVTFPMATEIENVLIGMGHIEDGSLDRTYDDETQDFKVELEFEQGDLWDAYEMVEELVETLTSVGIPRNDIGYDKPRIRDVRPERILLANVRGATRSEMADADLVIDISDPEAPSVLKNRWGPADTLKVEVV